MPQETLKIERLQGGLRAVFVNRPYFRTHAARIILCAGASHETSDSYGAAHFLEHITFQGTKDMPTEKNIHEYVMQEGLARGATTRATSTEYMADGYSLDAVLKIVSQLAFAPRLLDEVLEKERAPIVEEVRGYASDPFFGPNTEHRRALRGDAFARSLAIGGTVEDVLAMTPEALRAFHKRHYFLGNAILVIAAPESAEQQRECTQNLFEDLNIGQGGEPNPIEHDPFNPGKLVASLQLADLPLTAQTSLNIDYDIPEAASKRGRLGYNLVAQALSRIAQNRLRHELALCYGAGVLSPTMVDAGFGRLRHWSHLSATTRINGDDAVLALKALYHDVLTQPIPGDILESILVSTRHDVDHILQSNPSQNANFVGGCVINSAEQDIDLRQDSLLADSFTLAELRDLHRNIIDTKPIVRATSPDPAVLRAIGDWAVTKN